MIGEVQMKAQMQTFGHLGKEQLYMERPVTQQSFLELKYIEGQTEFQIEFKQHTSSKKTTTSPVSSPRTFPLLRP